MKNDLQFDFVVDKPAKTIYITREFDAGLSLVWEVFTKAELLDKWVAPAPMKSVTKYMNFEVGGKRFYAMVSPDALERWSIQEYKSITPKTNFKMFNAFADKDENPQLPGSDWDYNFIQHLNPENKQRTIVKITVFNESFERMENLLEGFKIGFTMSLENLETLLEEIIQKS
jgi:uncharacterized protein YndB with AHSA1/START domain